MEQWDNQNYNGDHSGNGNLNNGQYDQYGQNGQYQNQYGAPNGYNDNNYGPNGYDYNMNMYNVNPATAIGHLDGFYLWFAFNLIFAVSICCCNIFAGIPGVLGLRNIIRADNCFKVGDVNGAVIFKEKSKKCCFVAFAITLIFNLISIVMNVIV